MFHSPAIMLTKKKQIKNRFCISSQTTFPILTLNYNSLHYDIVLQVILHSLYFWEDFQFCSWQCQSCFQNPGLLILFRFLSLQICCVPFCIIIGRILRLLRDFLPGFSFNFFIFRLRTFNLLFGSIDCYMRSLLYCPMYFRIFWEI